MNNQTIVCCVVALLLGMLLDNMLKNICGCKLTEGQNSLNNNNATPELFSTPGGNNNNNTNPCNGVNSDETIDNIDPACLRCLFRAGWTGTAIGEDVLRWESCRGDSPDTVTGLRGCEGVTSATLLNDPEFALCFNCMRKLPEPEKGKLLVSSAIRQCGGDNPF